MFNNNCAASGSSHRLASIEPLRGHRCDQEQWSGASMPMRFAWLRAGERPAAPVIKGWIALLITIASINFVGDQLRDVLNRRLQR
ncbi:MAG: hypothetical protein OXC08_13960 [Thiotrichales bacterium]|nr:hypothetical protein [Thiotrichales bacterium]